DYTKLLHEDVAMRRLIGSRLRNAGVARIETERSQNQLTIIIQTAKPGIVIGKQGASVDALRDELERISGKKVRVTIHEIKSPEVDAKLVAESVASQLEKRIAFRRAIKQSIMRTMRAGAKGVKIQVSGRLGGSEMSRREWDRDGRVPLHTLRANIDYGQAEARTTFGRIGVTVWIYKGDFVTATGEPILPGGDGRGREEGGDGAPERGRRTPAARAEGAAARPEPARPAEPRAPAAEPVAAVPAPAPAPAPAAPRPARPWSPRWRRSDAMLMPKRTKHRKIHRGYRRGAAQRGSHIAFGTYGLQALEASWITNRQIESARRAMTRHVRRGGQIWIRIFPDHSYTKKPAETRMGSGKGSPEGWVAVVKPGRVLFEMSGVTEEVAKEAMRLAAHKLPIRTHFLIKAEPGAVETAS